MKICQKCDAANDDTAEFCGLCLQRFESANSVMAPGDHDVAGAGYNQPSIAPSISPAATATIADAPEQELPYDAAYVPPAPDAYIVTRQKTVLLPAAELLNNSLSFFMDNMKFYIILSISLSALTLLAVGTGGGVGASSVLPILTSGRATPEDLARLSSGLASGLLVFGAMVSLLTLFGRLVFLTATVEMSKGYDVGVASAMVDAAKKFLSFIWIAVLQSTITGGVFMVGVVCTLIVKGHTPVPLIIGAILGLPIAVVTGAWFSLSACVYLDKGTRGLAALAASKELIGERWPNVCWRLFVFAAVFVLVQAIPVLGWMIGGMILTPISAIFPWLLYNNLRALEAARL